MSQQLTMPFKRQMMLCGYKNPRYLAHWSYNHLGVDISTIQGKAGNDHNIYASGNGTVVAAGYDNGVGGVAVIIYPDCVNHQTGAVASLVARYFHMASVVVKGGDKVKRGDVIGVEGKEKTTDYHLHLEFDSDTNYPCWSPQVAGSNIIKAGIDTTVNPSYILYVGDGQVIVPPTYNPAWLNAEDRAIPNALSQPEFVEDTELMAANKNIEALNVEIQEWKKNYNELLNKLNAIKEIVKN